MGYSKMPIDINNIREERGGDPDLWREFQQKRFSSTDGVDEVIELDKVSSSI
jgi:seryl-tRNA synthetase